MFSCEYCEIFKNTFFYRILPVAASLAHMCSENFKKFQAVAQRCSVKMVFLEISQNS